MSSKAGLRTPVAALAVAMVALVVYAVAIGNGFAYDDVPILLGDPRLAGPDLGAIITGGYWQNADLALYRPVTTLSFALDWALAPGSAPWFHLTNILLHAGRPVVADFGIALAVSAAGGGRMTETGLSLGTPHYMSPEQASADRDLSARSDVYSLGCVLYEMLAGQPPHTGPSAQSILVRILTDAPKPLTELRHTVPPHVAAAVAKSIEKLPCPAKSRTWIRRALCGSAAPVST